jgi:hypothetical protein
MARAIAGVRAMTQRKAIRVMMIHTLDGDVADAETLWDVFSGCAC